MKSKQKIRKHRLSAIEKKESVVGYLMLLPAVVCLSCFVIIPLAMSIKNSIFEWNFYRNGPFVGLKYYKLVLNSPLYHAAYKNVFKYMLFVPIGMASSFFFALLMRSLNERYVKVVKVVTYIPGMTSGMVTGTIFTLLFALNGGLINELVKLFGGQPIAFAAHEWTAMIMIQTPGIIFGLGSGMIMYYAALMNIPQEYYEAASVDGANSFQKFFAITIPQMRNIFFLGLINGVTGSLMIFELPMSMTGGGPLNTTMPPALQLYYHYRSYNFPKSAVMAAAIILMILVGCINAVIFKFFKSEKSLEG